MTTNSRFSDILRFMLANAPAGVNLAVPAETLHQARPLRRASLWRDSLANRDDRVVIADWDGFKLRGLASARALNGAKAWRIDRFHLNEFHLNESRAMGSVGWGAAAGLELLEAIAQAAGQQGAERVFLRTAADSPVASLAQRTGYFPSYQETHLRGQPVATGDYGDSDDTGQDCQLSSPAPHEEYALFQLYCAATPQPVRESYGLTFDQWRASRELGGDLSKHSYPQWALGDGARIHGWVSLCPCGPVNAGTALIRPEHTAALTPLLAKACAVAGEQSWLVADYQQPVASHLLRKGLEEAGRYTMFIKTMAAPAINREYSMAEA